MLLTYWVIWGSWIIFGASTIAALSWAVRSGQFDRLEQDPLSIFDEGEPLGQPTDVFPSGNDGPRPSSTGPNDEAAQ